MRQEVGQGANILGDRFVLLIKNKDTDKEMFKARYVVQGHLDWDKNMLVHNSTNVGQKDVWLLISIATIFGFEIWSEDMSQAYLQGAERTLRKVYITWNSEFQLENNKLLELLRPLYWFADAGDYRLTTYLLYPQEMIDTHMDDIISAGDRRFEQNKLDTARRFDTKLRELVSFAFASVAIVTNPDLTRTMHQRPHA